MTVNCLVVDAGARYGLHPTWADLQGLADFHLFEMDPEEARRLERKYASDARIRIHPVALYSSDTTLTYRISQHRALNSVFQSNHELLRQNEYKLREFAGTEERKTEARSIDSLFAGQEVHFMKLDVEGAEYEVLKGAAKVLSTRVLGVRSEVLFAPVYEGAPLFGDLHRLLLDHGLELLNFDYTGAGIKAGRFALPGHYGKLLSSDAVWVIGNDRLFAAKGEGLLHDVVRFSLFLMNNGATDLAIDTLLRAVTREGVSFESLKDDPLFHALHRKALFLFKALLGFPMLQETDITSAYRTIFGRDFPLMSRFYESID
jgi:FkbM family methyltransferase